MATVSEWTCDRCKTLWRSDEWDDGSRGPLNQLSITNGVLSVHGVRIYASVSWCESCMVNMGLLKLDPKDTAVPPPDPPTIDGLIREIVREEIDAE